MARIARVVVPGAWHHATQRGNHQQTVFFGDADRICYLELLRHHTARYAVHIVGYCLMGNHVHIVATPTDSRGLANALGRTHNDYSRWLNLQRRDTGHVWQNRFYSCPLDERHGWEALRYVELNPVRAGLVEHPAEWRWSSAGAHLTGADDTGLIDLTTWTEKWTPASWREVLDLQAVFHLTGRSELARGLSPGNWRDRYRRWRLDRPAPLPHVPRASEPMPGS